MSRQAQYYMADCALCGKREIKRNLTRVMLRDGNSASVPKVLTFLCEVCVPKLAEFLECDVPELDTQRRNRGAYCKHCYTDVGARDRFCKHCGMPMKKEVGM